MNSQQTGHQASEDALYGYIFCLLPCRPTGCRWALDEKCMCGNLPKRVKLKAFISKLESEAEEVVTYDSLPLGWHDDSHHRLVVAIKGGKIVNSASTTDDNIKHYGGGGQIVTEANIQEYGRRFLANPRDKEAER